VSVLPVKEFDGKGEYTDIVQAVKAAGDGSVTVFRVEYGKSRVQYFVVSLGEKREKVVGVAVKAVES
jgi:hypothetical protein